MHRFLFIAALAAALAWPAAHAAEAVAAPSTAADATARVPEARYDSAFIGFQGYREQQPAPWREVNDEAHKAGGHIGIFGGAHGQHGAKPASASPQPENKK